jgi:hypothetical protein
MKPSSLADPFFALLQKNGICELLHAKAGILIVDFQKQSAATRAAVGKAHRCVDMEERKRMGGGHF